MGAVITIIGIILIIIYFVALNSKKESPKEKFSDAVDTISHSAADTVSGMTYKLTESKDKKAIRLARETLANKNGRFFMHVQYDRKDEIKELFEISDTFKKALDTLGLTEERWKKVGQHLLYISVIKHYSEMFQDRVEGRRYVVEKLSKDKYEKDNIAFLLEALAFYHIETDEWIKFGGVVLDMYRIYSIPDVEEYGIIPVWR